MAQAVELLIGKLSPEDRETVKNTPFDKLVRFHHGWGTGIRNAFGLWGGNAALLADCGCTHPDDASMVIIEAVWKRLQ